MKNIAATTHSTQALNRNQLRAETTRALILSVARALFMEKGYYQTTVEEMLEIAQISKGAFYHHFKTKAEAFLGVYIEMHDEIARAARASAAQQSNPWDALIATFDRYFLEVSRPEVYRLLLLDAKSVLTRATQLEIDNQYGNAAVADVIGKAIEAGFVSRRLEPHTPVIVGGVVDSLVDWCACQPNPTSVLKIAQEKFMMFLETLRLSKNPCDSAEMP